MPQNRGILEQWGGVGWGEHTHEGTRTNWQPIDWENIFTNPSSNKGLICNVYKVFKKLNYRGKNNPIKNGVQS